jgi:hypothetical protein
MTERDEAAEGFLERWSRKKIEAEHEAPPPATDDRDAAEAAPAEHRGNVPAPAAAPVEFDLSQLPSLDSITAATDIRNFLAPGVPKEIARAALRRAWSADPAIRDFKGLAENDWDFTDPTAMPGFGALPPGTDVKKLVAQIFGEHDGLAEPGGDQPAIAQQPEHVAVADASPPAGEEQSSIAAPSSESVIARRDNDTAAHHNDFEDEAEQPARSRHHGGALPQ